MQRDLHNEISLELARRVAAGLSDHPEWVETAKSNLERWTRLNADAPGLLRCSDEWRAMLRRPLNAIRAVLTSDTPEGRRMRTNSPFAGALPAAQDRDIKRRRYARTRHETTPA